jgi:hypothetical protein
MDSPGLLDLPRRDHAIRQQERSGWCGGIRKLP